VAVRRVPDWLWQLERLVIGPKERNAFWDPLAWPFSVVNDAIGYALLVCLLGAAIDRALRYSRRSDDQPEQTAVAAAEPPAPADEPYGNGRAGNGYYPHAPVPPPPGPIPGLVPPPPPPLVPPPPVGAPAWGAPPPAQPTSSRT
jgi:hypothetical protein